MAGIYFISDIHLGLQDDQSERRKLDKLEYLFSIIRSEGHSLYMLGDIFDYWLEFRHLIPKGFTRFLCLLSDLVRHNIDIVYVAGNHDFSLDRYFDEELGVKTMYGMNQLHLDGSRFIVAHGDGLGDGDIGYKIFSRFVRNRFNLSLLKGFHPDLALGLLKWLSQLSRTHKPVNIPLERDRLLHYAEVLVTERDFDYFICGHNHVKGIVELSDGSSRYVNLGTWIDGGSPYAVFRNGVVELREV
ncbi:MAG: UDP-2,3-diacylglucosamine diphosphatase [Chlorobium sp.]|nr:MAG: UDP-2,3-diacylglucosamine diphosphatase [Chlorobium sp.]